MKEYRYLIIGGGMTAAAALKGIREVDAHGSIGLLTTDTHRPYARPPLSKALWKGQTTVEKIMSKIPDGVDLHMGCTAQALDVAAKQVTDGEAKPIATRSCCSLPAARRAVCPLAATISSTIVPWTITCACAAWRHSIRRL